MCPVSDMATEGPAGTHVLNSGFILTSLKILNEVIYAPVVLKLATEFTFFSSCAC
jgi:hypothetical protein